MKKNLCLHFHILPMPIKPCRVVTYCWKNPHAYSGDLLITWSREKYKTLYLHFCNIYGHQTWQNSYLGWVGEQSLKLREPLIAWSHDKWKNLINTLPQYLWPSNLTECNLRSEDPTHQVMLPFDQVVSWQMQDFISPLPQYLWPPNLTEW